MEYEAECFSTLARLLEAPDGAFAAELALATDPDLVPATAAGHVALFAERVAGLSDEERQELFVETFRGERDLRRRCIVTALRESRDPRRSTLVIESLGDLLTTLLNDRNPYHHLIVAVSTLLALPAGGRG